MNVLLDTHVLIWWIENSRRLGRRAKAAIQDDATTVWISAVSIWEISIKAALGLLNLKPAFDEELIADVERSGFRKLSIDFKHACAVRGLPLHHTDPFDRMLIAQAQCEGLTLFTADDALRAYNIPTFDAAT